MRRFELMIPVIADAISGAFGGAILGSAMDGFGVTVVFSSLGGIFMLFHGIHIMRAREQKSSQPK